tara:strand:+ start:4226 stop:5041 length:816 start_codon:yes stop_codon:yes gene_type:complete
MKILLTGHRGFIGKATASALKEAGHKLLYFEKENLPDRIPSIVEKVDVVMHQGGIANTVGDANELMYNNYLISKKIFDIAHDLLIKVVFASSASVYGAGGCPSNAYGWSKYCAEQYGLALAEGYPNTFISLRYFNVYGPGEEHKGKMASVAYQAYKAGKFNLFVGSPRRDFVYIKDVVSANIFAIKDIYTPNGEYDVGSGKARLFEDVCELMDIPYKHKSTVTMPRGYQFHTCAKKKKWLNGWKPKFSLEDGIADYKEYLDGRHVARNSMV